MRTRSIDRIGAVVTLGLHLVAAAALLAYEPSRQALFAAAPIMVSLITPAKAEPKPEPPVAIPPPPKAKRKPVVKPVVKEPESPPVVSAPVEAPSPSPILAAPSPPPPAPAPVAVAPPVEVVTPPLFDAAYLQNPQPVYPQASIRFGEQGRVWLRVLVSATGVAEEVQIHASSGHSRLDDAARDTVRRWRFVPARRGDAPIAAWVQVPVSFTLD